MKTSSLETILIAEIIKARKKNKITQAELSEKTGFTQTSISRIENGKVSPSLRTFSKIAEAVGYDLQEKLND